MIDQLRSDAPVTPRTDDLQTLADFDLSDLAGVSEKSSETTDSFTPANPFTNRWIDLNGDGVYNDQMSASDTKTIANQIRDQAVQNPRTVVLVGTEHNELAERLKFDIVASMASQREVTPVYLFETPTNPEVNELLDQLNSRSISPETFVSLATPLLTRDYKNAADAARKNGEFVDPKTDYGKIAERLVRDTVKVLEVDDRAKIYFVDRGRFDLSAGAPSRDATMAGDITKIYKDVNDPESDRYVPNAAFIGNLGPIHVQRDAIEIRELPWRGVPINRSDSSNSVATTLERDGRVPIATVYVDQAGQFGGEAPSDPTWFLNQFNNTADVIETERGTPWIGEKTFDVVVAMTPENPDVVNAAPQAFPEGQVGFSGHLSAEPDNTIAN